MRRINVWMVAAIVLMMALGSMSGCGSLEGEERVGDETPSKARSGKVKVTIKNYKVRPQELEVSVGTKVTWVNKDKTQHIVTSNDGLFDAVLDYNESFSYTFKKKGTFKYKNRKDPVPGMRGKIVVR